MIYIILDKLGCVPYKLKEKKTTKIIEQDLRSKIKKLMRAPIEKLYYKEDTTNDNDITMEDLEV